MNIKAEFTIFGYKFIYFTDVIGLGWRNFSFSIRHGWLWWAGHNLFWKKVK